MLQGGLPFIDKKDVKHHLTPGSPVVLGTRAAYRGYDQRSRQTAPSRVAEGVGSWHKLDHAMVA